MKEFQSQKCMKIVTDEDVLQAMEWTGKLAESLGFLHTDQLLLRLVTEEAIVNAREYSSKNGQNEVKINWDFTHKVLVISVKQLGAFYSINKKEDINYGLRGRGLQLILNIMEEVWLEQEGTNRITLYMKKCLNNERER